MISDFTRIFAFNTKTTELVALLCVAFVRGATGLSAVCDCGIS